MKNMKDMKVVLVMGLIGLLAIIFVKSFGYGHFRGNAEKWAQPSMDQANLITQAMLNTLHGNTLMIDLSESGDRLKDYNGTINIPASAILEKDNLKKLHAHKGNILLVSDDPALSARIWMLLSQMGYRNLYILEDSTDNEVLKYEFRPD
jgi:hypothetical protein